MRVVFLPFRRGEDSFPHPEGSGGDFDELILVDVIQTGLEAHLARALENNRLVFGRASDVGLGLDRGDVDSKVDGVAMLADDHPLVAGRAGGDEHRAVVFDLLDGVGGRRAFVGGDKHAQGAFPDLGLRDRSIFAEGVVDDAVTFG